MKKFLLLFLLVPTLVFGAAPVRDNTYVSDTTIEPSDVTRNEDAIFSYLQAGVDTIATNAVGSPEIAANAVGSSELSNGENFTVNSLSTTTTLNVTTVGTMSGLSVTGAVKDGSSSFGTPNQFLKQAGSTIAWSNVGKIAQVDGTSNSPTTTSVTYVDLADMFLTVTTGANPVLVLFSSTMKNGVADKEIFVIVNVDGSNEADSERTSHFQAGRKAVVSTSWMKTMTSGTHTFKIQWKVGGDTGTAQDTERAMQVIELVN